MSAKIRQLVDGDNETVYPVTAGRAVFLNDGKQTVQEALDNLQDGNLSIKFPADNQIVKKLSSGDTVTTVFNDDGSIVETTVSDGGVTTATKTVTFNEDGSIDIKIV